MINTHYNWDVLTHYALFKQCYTPNTTATTDTYTQCLNSIISLHTSPLAGLFFCTDPEKHTLCCLVFQDELII